MTLAELIPEAERTPVIAITAVAAIIVVQHFVSRGPAGATVSEHFRRKALGGLVVTVLVLSTGVGLLGRDLSSLGLGLEGVPKALPWVAGGIVTALAFTFLAARRPKFREAYPEAPVRRWTRSLWLANAGSWAVYLFGYELLFRGLCLRTLIDSWGVASAIAVTTAIYVVAHLPKNLGESLGSFPMGVIFASLVIVGDSVLPAFLLHLALPLSAETFALLPAAHDSESPRSR